MSAGPFRLPLDRAALLAAKIADDLRPMCEPGYCVVAGSIRRRCELIGDIEIVCIPKYSKSLLPDVPGVSLLDMHLVALMRQQRLMRAFSQDTRLEELVCKDFYVGSLFKESKVFKVQINVSTPERWPVELAIKTGSAAFSKMLVSHSTREKRGFLPKHWRVADGWKIYEDLGNGEERQLIFESERHFIETICGAWVPPEKRD